MPEESQYKGIRKPKLEKGKESKLKRKKKTKRCNRNQYSSRKSLISQGSSRVGVLFIKFVIRSIFRISFGSVDDYQDALISSSNGSIDNINGHSM